MDEEYDCIVLGTGLKVSFFIEVWKNPGYWWFYQYELDRVVIHTPFHLNDIYMGMTLVIFEFKIKLY